MLGLIFAALIIWGLWRGEFFQEYGLKIYKALPYKYTFGPPPQAETSAGRVEGRWLYSQQGRVCAGFYGVPYAAPPLGKLRFRRPQTPLPWQGVRSVLKHDSKTQTYIGEALYQVHFIYTGEHFSIWLPKASIIDLS